MSAAEQALAEDILSIQDMQGTNLIYQTTDEQLVAIELDEEGDEVARYNVHIALEKI